MPVPHVALAVLIAAIWGFNFVVIRLGLDAFPPLLFNGLRFVVASLPFLLFFRSPGVPWRWVIGVGLVLGVMKFSLLFLAMAWGMPAGLASVVMQAQALFSVVFAALLLGERPGQMQWVGLAIAAFGLIVIATDMEGNVGLIAFLTLIAAAACWGLANIMTRRAAAPKPLAFMIWVSAVPPLPMFGLSWIFEGPDAMAAAFAGLELRGLLAVLYIGLLSTTACFAGWSLLLRQHTASLVAPFTLLVPVFGLLSAWAVLDEMPSTIKLGGAALILFGLLVNAGLLKRLLRQPARV
ncbi:EamA family transporter [Ferrovibrio terrae]|uniref:EamA family transporter n=1 Tax=Ferrovibrio terrae TaxID=2594003 RepID=A0A516GZ22_9PROT|nr:EamA family transporter [Ferrovibrio terrae]QDO96757.1 EamA family transporter [Ferrovibrio terrae]